MRIRDRQLAGAEPALPISRGQTISFLSWLLAAKNLSQKGNTKVLVKLFQKLAGSRDGVPCRWFGGQSPLIYKKNSLIPMRNQANLLPAVAG